MKYADMHCDTLSELYLKKQLGQPCSLLQNDLHIDLQKLKQGGCILQNFAVFVNLKKQNNPYGYANSLIDLFYEQVKLNEDKISPVTTYDEIIKNEKEGKISALLTLEEGGVVGNTPEILHELFLKGIRMATLTWNYDNSLSTSNTTEDDGGLSSCGFEFLKIAEDDGVIIDVSHLSDKGFWDVAKYSKKPFVASHSNSREICPHKRNLSDDMIKEIGNRGGIIGVNFYSQFVKSSFTDSLCMAEQIAEHAVHMVNEAGEDAVALGADFDGMKSDNLEISNSSLMPLFESALQKHGLCSRIRDKIMYQNVLNFYKEML